MEPIRVAPLVGILACLAFLAAIGYPFLVAGTAVGAYYGSGAVNPLVGALLALVAIVVFAAGREGRSDPGFAAGVTLVFGAAVAVIVFLWAATARVDAIPIAASHRWVAAVLGAAVAAAALWYARALGLV